MWIRSQDLGAYVTEMERRASDHQLTSETEHAFSKWVTHAREHAQGLDAGAIPASLDNLLAPGSTYS